MTDMINMKFFLDFTQNLIAQLSFILKGTDKLKCKERSYTFRLNLLKLFYSMNLLIIEETNN